MVEVLFVDVGSMYCLLLCSEGGFHLLDLVDAERWKNKWAHIGVDSSLVDITAVIIVVMLCGNGFIGIGAAYKLYLVVDQSCSPGY